MEVQQPRSYRRGGDGQWGREDLWQDGGWQTLQSHIYAQINWEEQRGSETDSATPGLQREEIKLQATD